MYVYDTKRWTWNKVKYGLGKLLRLLYNIVEYLNELITNWIEIAIFSPQHVSQKLLQGQTLILSLVI